MTDFDREEAAFRAAFARHSADAPTDLPSVQARPRRRRWVVGVAAAAAIVTAMAGAQVVARDRADKPSSANPTSSTTVPTAVPTAVDARSGLLEIPDGPAPADFVDRAEQVAKAIRASGGLTAYRSELHLLSPVVTVPDNLPSDALKVAFDLGLLTPGPAVTEKPTTTSVTFADGTTRTLRTLGAQGALVLGRRGPRCVEVNSGPGVEHIDPCPVVIIRAELTTQPVMTNHGAADLPAWEYWADGMNQPYVVLAVDPDDLDPPPTSQAMHGRGMPEKILNASGLVTATQTSVTALLDHGACDRAMLGHVWEADDLVVVGGTYEGPSDGPCPSVLQLTPSVLQLEEPLGTRPIVDVVTGRVLGAWR